MDLIDLVSQTKGLSHWLNGLIGYDKQLVLGLNTSAKAVAIAAASRIIDRLAIITANDYELRQLQEELTNLVDCPVYIFSSNDIVLAEYSTLSPEILSERIEALDFIQSQASGIVLMTTASAKKNLVYPTIWQQAHLTLQIGEEWTRESLLDKLRLMGYMRQDMVQKPGDYSIRGSIIDIYPLTTPPVRIDFFDDEIDTIRYFNIETQRSSQSTDTITISPATDVIVDKERYTQASDLLCKELENERAAGKDKQGTVIDDIYCQWSQGERTDYDRYFIPYFYPKAVTILDYLSEDTLLILDDLSKIYEIERHLDNEMAEVQTMRLEENQLLHEVSLFSDLRTIIKKAPQSKTYFSLFHKGLGRMKFDQVIQIQCQSMQQFFGQLSMLKAELLRYRQQNMTVILSVSDKEYEKKVLQILEDIDETAIISKSDDLVKGEVQLTTSALKSGFEMLDESLVIMTERELFETVQRKKPRRRQNISNAERIKSYNELEVGDYVVHVNHGIGRYLGMETIEVDGVHQDYMTIAYQNDDKLFIPVTQLNLVQKYVGSHEKAPKLNRLDSKDWHRTKRKVVKRVEDMADELIELYAKREAEKGFAFSKDNEMQEDFENAFPYAETEDQLRSIEEIKKDMEKERPMDRLLVGDVGYGKTEVALRAAFKAVQDNKQVAILVPTTILAQQHYETMAKRMSGFPIRVEFLNRFKTPSEQRKIVEELKQGTIDIIVGTHRLLSQDIVFKDLGLLIIDEEQRFGVRHKERLKQLKATVDALTLTATPIPRTLHMSMLGVRDLSVIETPPQNRYPVQTYVMERNNGAIREGILRELARNGQVFYLYNRVETIEKKVHELQELVPDARIAYAHGQMNENELEGVLMSFLEGEYDVLVTTTIIETGVDMPNVNTIFVDEADRMGLSQLYQLRGRVGRSNRIAFAYFMYEPFKMLSEVSEKRLEALKEFTELGAGFKIAMRDLSIRGAGDMLGSQQHGFIDSVGFDLYSQLLQEAVLRKQGKLKDKGPEVSMDLGIDAYIPENYIQSEPLKIEMYKRLREVETDAEIDEIEDDLMDRFGEYPDEVSYLLMAVRLKVLASNVGIQKIQMKNQRLDVVLTDEASKRYKPNDYMKALEATKMKVKFDIQSVMHLHFQVGRLVNHEWMQELLQFLEALNAIKSIKIKKDHKN